MVSLLHDGDTDDGFADGEQQRKTQNRICAIQRWIVEEGATGFVEVKMAEYSHFQMLMLD